jgi:hypothetical protein
MPPAPPVAESSGAAVSLAVAVTLALGI